MWDQAVWLKLAAAGSKNLAAEAPSQLPIQCAAARGHTVVEKMWNQTIPLLFFISDALAEGLFGRPHE